MNSFDGVIKIVFVAAFLIICALFMQACETSTLGNYPDIDRDLPESEEINGGETGEEAGVEDDEPAETAEAENDAPIELEIVLLDGDEPTDDEGAEESGEAESPEAESESELEPEEEESESVIPSCAGIADCADKFNVCNLAYGVCELRAVWPSEPMLAYKNSPPKGTDGDVMVIDGQRFYVNFLSGSLNLRIALGDKLVGGLDGRVTADENRILLNLWSGAQGIITISSDAGTIYGGTVAAAQQGVLRCDESSPPASGTTPTDALKAGPYGAGFVDINKWGTRSRMYYPAKCGGLRTPPEQGTFPIVAILHGDGGGYLNYEYIAAHLATWGFVSTMPESDDTAIIKTLIDKTRAVDLSTLTVVLNGVNTTNEYAVIGHSRGTARLQAVARYSDPSALASVFLGPVDDGIKTPGMFMVFGASEDKQSSSWYSDESYAREETPKWKIFIKGGNHSLFTDHKVWSGMMGDGQPSIGRAEQQSIVCAFLLPLLQRAFGKDEPFASTLDTPPESPAYTVEKEL